MRLPSLDDRLSRAVAMFPACDYGADIGADHGRLSCYLLANDRCKRMCVADISAESLEKARRLLALHGLSERADIEVGDGLAALHQQTQAIAILGMGGHTLSEILLSGREKLQGAALVLSAHTQLPLVRETLHRLDYTLEREEIARAAGRFYVVMRAVPGKMEADERTLFLGPCLSRSCAEGYPAYLQWRIGATSCERTDAAARQLQWLKEEYERVRDGADR